MLKKLALLVVTIVLLATSLAASANSDGIYFREGPVSYDCDSPSSVTAHLMVEVEADNVWIAWYLAGPSDFSESHRTDFGPVKPGDVLTLTATGLPSGRHVNVHFSSTAYKDGKVVGQAGYDANIGWPWNCGEEEVEYSFAIESWNDCTGHGVRVVDITPAGGQTEGEFSSKDILESTSTFQVSVNWDGHVENESVTIQGIDPEDCHTAPPPVTTTTTRTSTPVYVPDGCVFTEDSSLAGHYAYARWLQGDGEFAQEWLPLGPTTNVFDEDGNISHITFKLPNNASGHYGIWFKNYSDMDGSNPPYGQLPYTVVDADSCAYAQTETGQGGAQQTRCTYCIDRDCEWQNNTVLKVFDRFFLKSDGSVEELFYNSVEEAEAAGWVVVDECSACLEGLVNLSTMEVVIVPGATPTDVAEAIADAAGSVAEYGDGYYDLASIALTNYVRSGYKVGLHSYVELQ